MRNSYEQQDADQQRRILTRKKWSRKLWQQFDSFVKTFTPESIQDLRPMNNMYLIAAIILVSYILTFSLFLAYGYKDTHTTMYLVPVEDTSLNSESQTCSIQTKEITTFQYQIDQNGYYNGQALFTYAAAIYNIELNNVALTHRTYTSYMATIQKNVDTIGENAMKNTLNINILTYLTYKYVYVTDDTSGGESGKSFSQIFSFVADLQATNQTFKKSSPYPGRQKRSKNSL